MFIRIYGLYFFHIDCNMIMRFLYLTLNFLISQIEMNAARRGVNFGDHENLYQETIVDRSQQYLSI